MPINLQELRRFRSIVVTGPQRSGTGICARMIAHDTGHAYIDEEDYGTKDIDAWKELVNFRSGVVIHSPAMARWVHEVGDEMTCIVWMVRPADEIIASQERIGWDQEEVEKAKYKDDVPPRTLEKAACLVKDEFWRTVQRPNIENWTEIEYHELRSHELWIGDREGWGVRQWRPEKQLVTS